ncbi:MAG: tetraacyldisaccharide 4'-kinase, partial [Chlamydiia bacterium]|nr:tetraacyldisaccharide 4'-kinase [Chlamydiia bacterium]
MHYRLLLWGQTLIEKGVWSWIFAPISLVWQGTVFCRNLFYQKGWFKSHATSPLVVSVGNLVAGGTGKTPFVALLATTFSHRKTAILTRGYGGDEEKLLAKRGKVYVGKDRVALAKKAEKEG